MDQIIQLIKSNNCYAIISVLVLSLAAYYIAKLIFLSIGRYIIKRSHKKTDDIVVAHLKLKRLALIASFLVILALRHLFNDEIASVLTTISSLVILWLIALSLTSLLSGLNAAHESRPEYYGVSLKGFVTLGQLIIVLVAIILSVSILTNKSPIALLAGVGAIAAVLMLIFQNTILSMVASVQIMANNLLKEGDFVEAPAYNANGTVTEISLHTIRVRNADMTYSHIPTYKILDTAFINYRGIQDSESRRIKRALILDQTSIKLCDGDLLTNMKQNEMLKDFMQGIDENDVIAHEVTNSALFRNFVEFYLKQHEGLYQEGKTLLVRFLAPEVNGMPLEVIAFTKTTDWNTYERIQAEIFEHLLALLDLFELRINQQWAPGKLVVLNQ